MSQVIYALTALTNGLRTLLFGVGVVLAVVATGDWATRTRRLNPFSAVARFMRSRVDPRLTGIERQVLRVGGHPTATPWWALVAYVIVAALLLGALGMVTDILRQAWYATSVGPKGVLILLFQWTFSFLRLALLVRVFSSWFPAFAASRWVLWSYGATEWMLRPLRRVIPTLGMVDITPIVAYFGLQLVESLLLRVLFSGL